MSLAINTTGSPTEASTYEGGSGADGSSPTNYMKGPQQMSPNGMKIDMSQIYISPQHHHIQASVKIVGGADQGLDSGRGGPQGSQVMLGPTFYNGTHQSNSGSVGQASGGSPGQKRKFPPTATGFLSNEDRHLGKLSNTAQITTPGPGSYGKVQDFVNNKYDRSMDENNTYVIKDNGHLNQRPQLYAAAKSSRDAAFISNLMENPGPGSYETNNSGFVDNQTIRGLKQQAQKLHKSPSPRNQNLPSGTIMQSNVSFGGNQHSSPGLQTSTNGALPNQNSISNVLPSYQHGHTSSLTQQSILEDSQQNQSNDGLLNSRMKRLSLLQKNQVNLGPGTYDAEDSLIRSQQKSNIKFGVSKTLREDPFVSKTTQPQVGPGSYEFWSRTVGHKIPNPTFTREPANRSMFNHLQRGNKKRNASIRDNFDEASEDDGDSVSAMSLPGPGSYIKDSSTFGKTSSKSEFFYQFGSSVDRFKHPNGSNSINSFKQLIGPGSYNSIQKPHSVRQQVFQVAGSSSFANSQRKPMDMFENANQLLCPGPGDYNPMKTGLIDNSIFKNTEPSKVSFNSKIDRFHVVEMKKPDPGKYNLQGAISPSSMVKNIPVASYRSGTIRELKFQIDQDVPGIGVYNPQDYTTIGIQKIQGGAPNNFSLLAKKNTMLGVPHIDINIDRAIYVDSSTPNAVGPGAYGGSKFKHIKEPSPRKEGSSPLIFGHQQVSQQNLFGNDRRFKDAKGELPGPGSYADVNKWHKKTYNLKFLNVA